MPKAKTTQDGLLDTWGRRNRKHNDRQCAQCGKTFKPIKADSRYCSRPCAWKNNGGKNRALVAVWWKNRKGYIEGRVWENDKPVRYKFHRWIVEQRLGRQLRKDEDVHHINGIKDDNRLDNLEIIGRAEHTIRTHTGRRKARAAIAKAEGVRE